MKTRLASPIHDWSDNSGTTRENKQVKRVSLYLIKLMRDSGRAL